VVTKQGDGTFRVEVRDAGDRGAATTHAVTVPAGMVDQLGWAQLGEAELVRASFGFLLEREPATSILSTFSLDVIGRYFPEFQAEIRRRAKP
jgi:hypothetical protein